MALLQIHDLVLHKIFLSCLGLLVALRVVQAIFLLLSSHIRQIPGPVYTLHTNLVLKWHVITGNRCHYIHRLHQEYGPIVRISPTEIAVADLESCQKIHKVNSGFLKTVWYEKLNNQSRNGIFAMTNPHEHAARRKLFAQAFSKTNLRTSWESVVVEKVKTAVASMLREALQGETDMLKWWTFMATDVSGHLMFGESFRMLEMGKKTEYIEVLEKVMMGGGIGLELPFVRWIGKRLPFDAVQVLFNGNSILMRYAEQAVRNARGASRNIFSNALAEAEKGNGRMDDLDVKVEAGNLIVAGSDTTAITLTYLIWAVASHPQVRAALELEVNNLSESFSDADLEALPLTNAAIEEALRLYGAAPGSLPRSVPASINLRGYEIPAGFIVSTQAWTLHRDPAIFEQPEIFNPYRWLNENLSMDIAKAAMSPFGKGSRTCLGIHLARMELRYGLVIFLRECRSLTIAASATKESMDVENFFLIAPKSHRCHLTMAPYRMQ